MSNGRVVSLMENAINLLGELPETHQVFVTSAHPQRLHTLSDEFKDSGLVDVVFVTVNQIREGILRGHKGVLLVDDFYEIPLRDQAVISIEQKVLERRA